MIILNLNFIILSLFSLNLPAIIYTSTTTASDIYDKEIVIKLTESFPVELKDLDFSPIIQKIKKK